MNNRILNCLGGKKYRGIPVWFMRQAGRYLPEFRKIRKENPNFIKLCLNENLSTKISLQPLKRFDLDAAIVFSDILMIPYGLGQKVSFKKNFGPQLKELSLEKIITANKEDFINQLRPVYKTIYNIRKKLNNNKSLIGFVGAPWTLLVYMLNKKSPKNNFNFKKIIKDELLAKIILNKLEEMICLHIDHQISAGADVIQIFDSWAGLLPNNKLPYFCYETTARIVNHVKEKKIPVICFPKGISKNYADFCSVVNPDCLSIDYKKNPKSIRKELKNIPIQGGLDPKILLMDNKKIKKNVKNYLDIFKDHPYIFNLGHGVLPKTKPEKIEYLINIIREKE